MYFGIVNLSIAKYDKHAFVNKERMLREQETRSGAGKSVRPKWFLFENLNFLVKHMGNHRKSITNINVSQPSTNKRLNQDKDFR
ncbi:hypothetical protein ACFW04_013894 [Cataglyphis niger]